MIVAKDPAGAASKRAARRGYKTRQKDGKLTLWDRDYKQVLLTDVSPDEVDAFLRDANKREARAWPK